MTTHTYPTPTISTFAPASTARDATETTGTHPKTGSTVAAMARCILGSMVCVGTILGVALALAGADLGYVLGLGTYIGFWVGGGFGLIAAGIIVDTDD